MTESTAMNKPLPRRRVAVGPPRPQYLQSVENDRLVMVVTALAAEVSALRDRLDTHETLASRGTLPTPEAVEAYAPDAAHDAAREAARTAMMKRVYRILTEELDAARERGAAPAAEWSMPEGWDKT